MTTLRNRPHTALVVIDVQNDVVAGTHARDAVVANIALLVEKARRAAVPVIWVQQVDEERVIDSEAWQIVGELNPAESDPRIDKAYGDSFEESALESVLADLAVGRLIVTGAQTDACVRSTLHGAIARGYDAILVSDAHTTEDLSAWGGATAGPGHRAHQSLLAPSQGAGPHSGNGHHTGRRFRLTGRGRQQTCPVMVVSQRIPATRCSR